MVIAPPRAPSALRVALRRAAHQLVDTPVVFDDPVAVPLLAPYAAELGRTPRIRHRSWSRSLRAFAVARSRYAEEQLAAAIARGVSQYCLLGAGLDTFAWRNPWAPTLGVWEVDRPEMIHWKDGLVVAAGFAPERRVAVAADIAAPGLAALLAAAGLQPGGPVVFAMLGVAPYLKAEAFRPVLELVQSHGAGSGIVLDYRLPRSALGADEQKQFDSLGARLEAAGEPFESWWTRDDMQRELRGFAGVEQLGAESLNERYFAGRSDGLAVRGEAVQVASAWVA